MKFLFVVRNPSFFFHYRAITEYLCDKEHHVTFLLVDPEWKSAGLDSGLLENFKRSRSNLFDYALIPKRVSLFTRLLRIKREIVNYWGYIKEAPISESRFMRERAMSNLPSSYRWCLGVPVLGKLLVRKELRWLTDWLEKVIPIEGMYRKILSQYTPDIVIASPYVFTQSIEIDFVRAAKKMNIKTAAMIYSWDNLTTKGILQCWPDQIVVWNQNQIKELEGIHGYPKSQVRALGAPSLDFWFDYKNTIDKKTFLSQLGIYEDKVIVTYLCSSRTIAPDEQSFVDEFAETFYRQLDPQRYVLLVRPHPENERTWFNNQNDKFIIAPKITSDIFRVEGARGYFYSTLLHSSCVVGMNTTAIIEALILSTPCISILSEKHKQTQVDTPHYNYLVDSGAVSIAKDFDKACEYIATYAEATIPMDAKAANEFVQSFVRPNGLNVSSSYVAAQAFIDQAMS